MGPEGCQCFICITLEWMLCFVACYFVFVIDGVGCSDFHSCCFALRTVLCLSGWAAAIAEPPGATANIARRFSSFKPSETVSYSIYLPQTTTKKEDTRGEHDAPNDLDFLGNVGLTEKEEEKNWSMDDTESPPSKQFQPHAPLLLSTLTAQSKLLAYEEGGYFNMYLVRRTLVVPPHIAFPMSTDAFREATSTTTHTFNLRV